MVIKRPRDRYKKITGKRFDKNNFKGEIMKIRIINSKDVKKALSMVEAINIMEDAFKQFSSNNAIVPLRSRIQGEKGTTLLMPAFLKESKALGIKLVSVYQDNKKYNLPAVNGLVLVFDPETGLPLAMIEGASLTSLRTGALGGLAAKWLSRKNAKTATLFGAGIQGLSQLEALFAVRSIEHVNIMDHSKSSARRLASIIKNFKEAPEVQTDISVNKAVESSDIIITATNSSKPVFDGNYIQQGTHITGVGSFTPKMEELDAKTMEISKIIVDSKEACMAEAGEIIANNAKIHGEIGEIITAKKKGRENEAEITFFKTVGIAVQDAAAGAAILKQAERKNIGQIIQFD